MEYPVLSGFFQWANARLAKSGSPAPRLACCPAGWRWSSTSISPRSGSPWPGSVTVWAVVRLRPGRRVGRRAGRGVTAGRGARVHQLRHPRRRGGDARDARVGTPSAGARGRDARCRRRRRSSIRSSCCVRCCCCACARAACAAWAQATAAGVLAVGWSTSRWPSRRRRAGGSSSGSTASGAPTPTRSTTSSPGSRAGRVRRPARPRTGTRRCSTRSARSCSPLCCLGDRRARGACAGAGHGCRDRVPRRRRVPADQQGVEPPVLVVARAAGGAGVPALAPAAGVDGARRAGLGAADVLLPRHRREGTARAVVLRLGAGARPRRPRPRGARRPLGAASRARPDPHPAGPLVLPAAWTTRTAGSSTTRPTTPAGWPGRTCSSTPWLGCSDERGKGDWSPTMRAGPAAVACARRTLRQPGEGGRHHRGLLARWRFTCRRDGPLPQWGLPGVSRGSQLVPERSSSMAVRPPRLLTVSSPAAW